MQQTWIKEEDVHVTYYFFHESSSLSDIFGHLGAEKMSWNTDNPVHLDWSRFVSTWRI